MQNTAEKVEKTGAKKKVRPSKGKRRRGANPRRKVTGEIASLIAVSKHTGLTIPEVKELKATGVNPKPKAKKLTSKQVKEILRIEKHELRQAEILRKKEHSGKGPKPPQHFPERKYEKKPPGEKKVFNPNHKTIVTYEQVKIGQKQVMETVPLTVQELQDHCAKEGVGLFIDLSLFGIAPFEIPFYEKVDGKKEKLTVMTPRLYPRQLLAGDKTISPVYDPEAKKKPIYGLVDTDVEKYRTEFYENPNYGKPGELKWLKRSVPTGKFKKKRKIIGYKTVENPVYKILNSLPYDEYLQIVYLAGLRPSCTPIGLKVMNSECTIFKYIKNKIPHTKTIPLRDKETRRLIKEDIFKVVRKSKKVSKVLKKMPKITLPEQVEKKRAPKSSPNSMVCIGNGVKVYRTTRAKAEQLTKDFPKWKFVDKTTWKKARLEGNWIKHWKESKPIIPDKPSFKKVNKKRKLKPVDKQSTKKKGKVSSKEEETFQRKTEVHKVETKG